MPCIHKFIERLERYLLAAGVRMAFRELRWSEPAPGHPVSFRGPPYEQALNCSDYAYAVRIIYRGRFFTCWHGSDIKEQVPTLGWMVEKTLAPLEYPVMSDSDYPGAAERYSLDCGYAERLRHCLGDKLFAEVLDMMRSFAFQTGIYGHQGEK
jgi:hypothetical protein